MPDVAPSRALRIGLYLLVLDGIAALYVADYLGSPGVLLVGALLALTGCVQWWGVWSGRPPRAFRLIVPVVALLSLVDVLYLAETVLDGLVRLLLFLTLYKLLTLRTIADTRPTGFLAFFMLVAASASAFGVGFLFVFVAFVTLATWVTLVQHSAMEAGASPGTPAPLPLRALAKLAAVATVGIFVVTAGFFFVLPRVGLAALPLRARVSQMMTGFSEQVELGAYGTIMSNASVVMRVHLPDEDDPARLPNLRWRGVVLDTFDGRVWSTRHPRRIRLVRPSAGGFDVGVLHGSGRVLRQEIYLEPIGSEAVFAAPRALRVSLPAPAVAVDDMGAVTAPTPGAKLRYTVESELESGLAMGDPRRAAWPLDATSRARYLQLPPLPARVHALARQAAGGSTDPLEVTTRLHAFLTREFRYSLDLQRVSQLDPLEEFLFVRRAGHCEYFAAAMAVMLRSHGIPARVVNGFQRGEWNPYGRYFMVRFLDAHSWVEAYLPGAGWTTVDPTPRAGAEAFAAPPPWLLYLDALRLRWHRYVINWSLRDQIRIANAIHVRALRWGTTLGDLRAPGVGRLLGGAAAAMLLAGVLAVGWRIRRLTPEPPRARVPGFYRRALRAVARRGLRPTASETAREFSARVAFSDPGAATPFARVTALYERARFGSALPGPDERADLETCVASLRVRRR